MPALVVGCWRSWWPNRKTEKAVEPLAGHDGAARCHVSHWNEGVIMSKPSQVALTAACACVVLLAAVVRPAAQSGLPNPYRPVKGLANGGGPSIPGGEWARLPSPSPTSVKEMGPPAAVHVDVDGESIWALIRCDETSPVPAGANGAGGRFGLDCMYPDGKLKPLDTIYRFNKDGKAERSFGGGMFIWPHGMHVDREGNIWVTDAASESAVDVAAKAGVKAGHIIRKFSPDGKVLMTLGEPGVAGHDEYHFRSPAGIVTNTAGEVFVADRGNTRIQIFDQAGLFISQWHQFGDPSGIAFSVNDEDLVYVFDSESDNHDNPGFEQGIRIGDALEGWVKYFIMDPGGDPRVTTGSGAEFGTVDKYGNVFGGEPRPRVLRKYVKVR